MIYVLMIFAFIFGSAIGSFLNVVIYRYGAISVVKGRSMCLTCGNNIANRDLIPILSFLLLGGKCRHCKTKLDRQYILVELMMAVLSALTAFVVFSGAVSLLSIATFFVLTLTVLPLLILIFVYDMKHQIIPDHWNYSFAASALIYQAIIAEGFPSVSIFISGLIISLPIYILHYISKGEWIGLGDAKLFVGVGFLLGPTLGISAFMLSFWIGAVISILLILYMKKNKYTLQSKIAFGPFIILATLIIFFTQKDFVGLSEIMYLFNNY